MLGDDSTAIVGEAASVGQKLLEYTEQLFTWWHRIRDGTLQLSSFQVYVSRHLRFRVRFELWYGRQFADAKTAATCGNLLAIEPALWTFVRKNGDIEPTPRPSAAFGMESCGALPASAPTAPTEAASSNGCLPCVTRCADRSVRISVKKATCFGFKVATHRSVATLVGLGWVSGFFESSFV